MSNRVKQVLLTLAIGVVGCLILALIEKDGGQSVAEARLAASDALMLRPNGPRFGSRAARKDIVLVQFDFKTASKLGYISSYTKDVELYRKLNDAAPRVIYDTRMIAAADEETLLKVKDLFDGMQSVRSDGKLMRDIWVSSSHAEEYGSQYSSLMSAQILNSHPHAVPAIASRLYPLTYFDPSGVHETAPLAIAREVWGLERTDHATTGQLLRESGVMSKWHEIRPEVVPKTDIPKSDYMIGEHGIGWHPYLPVNDLVPPVGLWVDYGPSVEDYQRLSYQDVVQGDQSAVIKDKIVIIGFSADIDPTSDVYIIPSTFGKASAAEVTAYATQTLLDGRNMRQIPKWVQITIGSVLIMLCALLAGLLRPLYAMLGVLLTLTIYFAGSIWGYRSDWFTDFLMIPAVGFGTAVAAGTLNAWFALRARQHIVDMFGRYVPRAIVNQLVQRSDLRSLMLGGLNRDVTVMFADIRGFTDFSQDLAPEAVVNELNSMLEKMVQCVFDHEGTLDKFIGDAILVLFNAPLNQADHSLRAVRTAIEIQKQLANHPSGLRIGIGVHRGAAVVGNIGTPQRMEYTAIGSTVNIASRLCDQAAPGEIVISQAVIDQLGNGFPIGEVSSVQVKGIKSALGIARIKV